MTRTTAAGESLVNNPKLGLHLHCETEANSYPYPQRPRLPMSARPG